LIYYKNMRIIYASKVLIDKSMLEHVRSGNNHWYAVKGEGRIVRFLTDPERSRIGMEAMDCAKCQAVGVLGIACRGIGNTLELGELGAQLDISSLIPIKGKERVEAIRTLRDPKIVPCHPSTKVINAAIKNSNNGSK
jgi:hypothetical protein